VIGLDDTAMFPLLTEDLRCCGALGNLKRVLERFRLGEEGYGRLAWLTGWS
jgi:hypothetical protein